MNHLHDTTYLVSQVTEFILKTIKFPEIPSDKSIISVLLCLSA